MSLTTLTANARLASAGLSAVRSIATLGDDAATAAAPALDDVATRLGALTGHDAQVLIGPRVNIAADAQGLVSGLARTAHAGRMPSMAAFADAERAVLQLTKFL